MIELRTLGGIDLRDASGAVLDDLLRQPKRVALLLYLALAEPAGFQRRDTLLALFWPDLDAARARAALRKSLYFLRGALGPHAILSRGDDEVGVDTGQLACDALAFEGGVAAGRTQEALELYRGDLAAGFHVSEVAPEWEEWLEERRIALRRRAAEAAWKQSAAVDSVGEAVRWARWASNHAPEDERGIRRLLDLLAGMGDHAGAMQVYEDFRTRLAAEYGVEPAPETQALVAAMGARTAAPPVFSPAGPGATAVEPPAVAAPARGTRRPWQSLVGMSAVAAALMVMFALSRRTPSVTLEPDRVAVAPFTILAASPGLAVWREGMVDVLSRNLDGAGPLRSVPPAQVILAWQDPDRGKSPARLGRRTGAGLVVIGSLVPLGGDSARLSSTVLDVATGESLGDVEIRGALDRMDVVLDSLTRMLLREIGRVRQIGSARFTGIGSRSVPALKAFLKAEQFRRQTAWDSVEFYDGEAVALDSTFALAWLRLGEANAVSRFPVPLASGPQADNPWHLIYRAGTLNQGLALHDSLTVAVGAGVAAFNLGLIPDAEARARAAKVYQMALRAARLYPNDVESWFGVALVQDFLGHLLETTTAQTYASYSRAIALDSAFAPAYRMGLRVSGDAGDVAGTRRLAERYLRLDPAPSRQIPLLIAGLLDPATTPVAAARLVDSTRNVVLWPAMLAMWMLPDSGEAALRIARVMAARPPDPRYWFTSDWITRRNLAAVLAYRGHLREALAVGGDRQWTWFPDFFPELAMLGAIPARQADSVFARWRALPGDTLGLPYVRWWWAERGDTANLARIPHYWLTDSSADAAALAVARGNRAEALRHFTAWRQAGRSGPRSRSATVEPLDYFPLEMMLRLLVAGGDIKEALAILKEREPADWPIPSHVVWALERARLSWLAGDRAAAARDYRLVAEVWRHADPELRGAVEEARDAVRRLDAGRSLDDDSVRARIGRPPAVPLGSIEHPRPEAPP